MTNNRVWEFDRYTHGRLKAEGIRITRAESEEQARLKAVSMALPGDVLVMRTPEAPAQSYHQNCPTCTCRETV